jgi:septal ring factor EnvC (AmiA/AmiB activator)
VSEVGGCLAGRAREARSAIDTQRQTARTQAEAQVRNTVARAGALRDELGKRVEPVVGQVQAQLGDIPERVVQAMEPVAARVRELAGNAA